jgi:hypothetical protein
LMRLLSEPQTMVRLRDQLMADRRFVSHPAQLSPVLSGSSPG